MTQDQMNDAIAEYLGWTHLSAEKEIDGMTTVRIEAWFDTLGYGTNRPEYSRCLNAMHRAEMILTTEQITNFVTFLRGAQQPKEWTGCMGVHATAYQRAEAFLRTVGKWEET